jgi:DNA-binding response OmpR family regulator
MKKTVLVVEDDALIAFDTVEELLNAGLEVIGPATSVSTALELLASTDCDVAVLDVNLGDETSAPIARELLSRGTPFIVVSGYSSEQHPPELQGAPMLSKPVFPGALVELVLSVGTFRAARTGS